MGKPENSLSDFIIGSPFLFEFASLPNALFNAIKPKIELVPHPLPASFRVRNTDCVSSLLKLFSNEDKHKSIALQYDYFQVYIKSIFLKSSVYKDEASEFFLGENLILDEKLMECLLFTTSFTINLTDVEISIFSKIRSLFSRYKYNKLHKYMTEVISKELLNRTDSRSDSQLVPNDAIDIIIKNKNKYSLYDYKLIGSSFGTILQLSSSINGSRLANFLIDVSFNVRIYNRLAIEQITIIEKYGFKINEAQLDDMVYLDAALKDSIRLTQRTVCERRVEKNYIFSNGAIIPKGSIVKFDLFSHSRNVRIHGNYSHHFVPERNLLNKTKLSDVLLDSFIWSAGDHKCPAIGYSVTQLKIAAAIFIRNFEITQACNLNAKHKGYEIFNTIRHVNTELYLKPHNILEYKFT
ncbi:hypothetical protein BB561_006301 [Smittium simulii]|uniref:Cytochrome P450 n=1 Tax=Smittium simulii TaxID=133385 RepID=A0A2T9Y5A1_9FUNG|nr:hypothetical protein BB561_006301 [Smittium simulii]